MPHFKKKDIIWLDKTHKKPLIIMDFLGNGCQADVYKAYDYERRCYVAAKHCYGRYASDKKTFYQKLVRMVKKPVKDPSLVWPLDVGPMDKNEGFVYTMPIVEGCRPFTDLITNKDCVPLKQKLKLLYMAAKSLNGLHEKGFIHGDISDRNLLYRIGQEGSVSVRFVDCDNVSIPGLSLGVQGSGRYRAPELLVLGKNDNRATPSIETERFSFYVLAFRVMMRRHPLDGKYARSFQADDYDGFLESYGKNPRFVFDGTSNAPSENIVRKWDGLPDSMRKFFQKAFSQEALKNPKARPDLEEFIQALAKTYTLI